MEKTDGRSCLLAGAKAVSDSAEHGRPSATSSMQVMVEVVGGRHITKEKGSLFVRYHGESSTGVITMNTKQLPATPTPQWAEALSMECTSSNGDLLSQLRSHFLVFELRWRSESLWGDLRGSKRIGSVKIAWKDLLESNSFSTEDWFPLAVKGELKDGQKPPALRLALSLTPPTPLPRVERRRNGNVIKRRSINLDRDECGCRGHTFNYDDATSFYDAAWGI